ncbi:hypothetical protein IFO70_10200 [Phormidium tenue FACHB-886]|nr:hypothetical protein [Phormidium tenue FACHB-886]
MTTTTLDRFPIAQLPDRYTIGRTALYDRINALSIEPERERNRAYVSPEQLRLLDALDTHLKQGKTVEAFLNRLSEQSELSVMSVQPANEQSELTPLPPSWMLLVESLAARLTPQPLDPLLPQRQLEEIADRGWVVSSSQLRQVLGVNVREGERLGFVFRRSGRVGRECGWKVVKV